ncbi:MAG: septum formation inhibitor Maf [Gammaproteobacteria bacterium]|nr:septum formation inhibitor Maf [Gammaproteobacteria bacterium]
MKPLVLGSSSPYRRQLLAQLQIPFETCSPDIDETAHQDEKAEGLVLRLAKEKALAVARKFPECLIIASDQVAVVNNTILGKPHNFENACQQLSIASNNTVIFYTSLCVLNAQTGFSQIDVELTEVKFRTLSEEQIKRYLQQDEPYNCAGSFRCERLGITLFESIHSNDPNALIGLPLIKLTTFLTNEGIELY